MTKETYQMLLDSMDRKERNEGKEDYYSFIKLGSGELHDFLVSLVYSDDGIRAGTNDLSYECLYDAIAFLADNDITLEELETMDVYDRTASEEFASIYTYNRLEYLNINNEDAIREIMEEYESSSISEACAVFYDNTVKDTLLQLRSYAKEY